jgi:DNA repair exonuclease SbcCD ATPase subunit
MKFRGYLRRLDFHCVTVGVVLVFAGFSQSAHAGWRQEQQTSQAQQQTSEPQKSPPPWPQAPDPSTPKLKKVWTNDDMPSLRSPADTYLAEKEAQESADAEAATKRAELEKQIKRAGLTIDLPATAEETQRMIKSKQERIKELKDRLDQLNQSPLDAPENQKAANQRQIEEFTGDSEKLQLEVKVLQDHLQSLAKPAPSSPPSTLPTPPSPENPL